MIGISMISILSGQNPLIWPLRILIIQVEEITIYFKTSSNFSKLLQTPFKLFQTLSTHVQTLFKSKHDLRHRNRGPKDPRPLEFIE